MLIFQNMIKEKNTVFFSGISNADFSKHEQPLYQASSVQYLEIKIFQQLRWHNHINNFATELNNASIMLYQVRQFANEIVI